MKSLEIRYNTVIIWQVWATKIDKSGAEGFQPIMLQTAPLSNIWWILKHQNFYLIELYCELGKLGEICSALQLQTCERMCSDQKNIPNLKIDFMAYMVDVEPCSSAKHLNP